jgi:hypothetical protein
VNEILADHNVDKQITDNKGDVAYLMADISDVNTTEIKEINDALESLDCEFFYLCRDSIVADMYSSNFDPHSLLILYIWGGLENRSIKIACIQQG